MQAVSAGGGAEKTIEFTYAWRFTIPEHLGNYNAPKKTIITAFGMRLYRWELCVVGDMDQSSFKARNQPLPAKFTLKPTKLFKKVPKAKSCLFTMVVRHPETMTVVLEAEKYRADPYYEEHDTNGDRYGSLFKVERNAGFAQKVNEIFESFKSPYEGYFCEIVSTITIPLSVFSLEYSTPLAPLTPMAPSYMTTLMLEETRNNFSIKSRDNEVLSTSKELLYLSSVFFRKYFREAGRNAESLTEPNFSYHAIKTVVTYILTSTFSTPPLLNPDIARECIKLGKKYITSEKKEFMNTLEKACSEILESLPLDVVVLWLLFAKEDFFEEEDDLDEPDIKLHNLQNAAFTICSTTRAQQFQLDYCGSEVAPHREPILDLLENKNGQSIMSKLEEYRIEAQDVVKIQPSEQTKNT